MMAALLLMVGLTFAAMMTAPDDRRAGYVWGVLAALGIAVFALGAE